jgi:hypothetical protein
MSCPAPGAGQLMPLEQYANVSAMLTREGNPDATFRRLGLDAMTWMSIVRTYARMFGEQPALQAEFDRLVDRALKAR